MKKFFCFFLVLTYVITKAGWVNVQTGINDDLTGIAFKSSYGLMSGKKGLYGTTTGGGAGTWSKVAFQGSPSDSMIYNNVQFYDCSMGSDLQTAFACGEDMINHKALLVKVNFPALTAEIVYTGASNSTLTKLGFHSPSSTHYAVGAQGLIVKITNAAATVVEKKLNLDFSSIAFYGDQFCVTTRDSYHVGLIQSGEFQYTSNNYNAGSFKSAVLATEQNLYITGNAHYVSSGGLLSKYSYYDFGALNGNCVHSNNGVFVGTDHGIFKADSYGTVLQWQPSSGRYTIQDITSDQQSVLALYACGKDGVFLKSTDLGGPVKPYVKLTSNGACVNKIFNITKVVGESSQCSWYIDDKLVSSECYDLAYGFNAPGKYKIKVIVKNASYADTSTQEINIVNPPQTNLNVSVKDSVLCHQEPLSITIDNSESGIYYSLLSYDGQKNYGSSSVSSGNKKMFLTNYLNETGAYKLRAHSNIANCVKDFTDTLSIKVEQTKALFYASQLNVTSKDSFKVFQTCIDAKHFSWTFPNHALVKSSIEAVVMNQFTAAGKSSIKLRCSSDQGCSDSVIAPGPMVYTVAKEGPCWVNMNQSDNDDLDSPSSYSNLNTIKPSKTGYFVAGSYTNDVFPSQVGEPYKIEGSGSYLNKYNYDGTLLWTTGDKHPYASITNIEEDQKGNIYLCGDQSSNFLDNTGSKLLNPQFRYTISLIKLDAEGKKKWALSLVGWIPKVMAKDASGNIILLSEVYRRGIPVYLDGIKKDTLSTATDLCNYTLTKVSPDGKIIWNASIYSQYTNSALFTKIGTDKYDNIYLTGTYEHSVTFYSTNSSKGQQLGQFTGNYGHVMFLAKYNSSGILQWKQKSNTMNSPNPSTIPYDMVTDENGNCYITGRNNSYVPEEVQVFENTDGSLTSLNRGMYFAGKVNSKGICEWLLGSEYQYEEGAALIHKRGKEISVISNTNRYQTATKNIFKDAYGDSIAVTLDPSCYFIAVYDTLGKILRVVKNGNTTANDAAIVFSSMFRTNDGSYYVGSTARFPFGYSEFGSTLSKVLDRVAVVSKFKESCGISSDPVTAVHDYQEINTNVIYPNPVKNMLHIEGFKSIAHGTITIMDIQQKLVFSAPYANDVSIDHLDAGMYIVMVIDDGELIYKDKIMKE